MGYVKFFITAILTFCLINTQMMMTSVWAEESGTPEASDSSRASNLEDYQKSKSSSSTKKDEGGGGTGTFVGEGGGEMSFMNLIVMIIIGAVARGMIACKLTTIDTITAAIGGGIYIFGELSTLMASNEMKKQEYQYKLNKDGSIVDSDRNALEAMKQNYEKAKKNLEKKKQLQQIAVMAWVAAAAIALFNYLTLEVEHGFCRVDPCKAALAAAAAARVACTTGDVTVTTAVEGVMASTAKSSIVFKLSTVDAPTWCGACAACWPYFKSLAASLNSCSEIVIVDNDTHEFTDEAVKEYFALRGMEGFYEDTLNHLRERESFGVREIDKELFQFDELFVPSANAILGGMTKFLGLGAVGVGIFLGLAYKKKIFIDQWMATPQHRALIFGALAALGYMAMNDTQKEIDKVQSNIDKLNALLGNMNSTGIGYSPGGDYKSPTADPGDITHNEIEIPKVNNIPCPIANCKPMDKAVAHKLKTNPGLKKLQNYPEGKMVAGVAKAITKFGGQLSKDRSNHFSKGTLATMGALTAKKAALDKAFDKIQRKYNSHLAAAGKPAVDLLKGNQLVGKLKSIPPKVRGGMLADSAFGGGKDSSKLVVADLREGSGKGLKPNKAYFQGGAKGKKYRRKRYRRNYGVGADSVKDAPVDDTSEEVVDDEYDEEMQNDIAPVDYDIWKMLSHRYHKLFERKSVEDLEE